MKRIHETVSRLLAVAGVLALMAAAGGTKQAVADDTGIVVFCTPSALAPTGCAGYICRPFQTCGPTPYYILSPFSGPYCCRQIKIGIEEDMQTVNGAQ